MIFGKGVNELCDQWRFRVPLAGFGTELVFILGEIWVGRARFRGDWRRVGEALFREASQLQHTKWVSGFTMDVIRSRIDPVGGSGPARHFPEADRFPFLR